MKICQNCRHCRIPKPLAQQLGSPPLDPGAMERYLRDLENRKELARQQLLYFERFGSPMPQEPVNPLLPWCAAHKTAVTFPLVGIPVAGHPMNSDFDCQDFKEASSHE